jgi:hypothetical protein
MLSTMTRKMPAGAKVIINARVKKDDLARLDALAQMPDSKFFERSRSELVSFAISEFVERHSPARPSKK